MQLLGQTDAPIWLTTIWLISLGVTIGLALTLVLLGVGYALSRVAPINAIFDNRLSRYIATGLMSVVILLLLIPSLRYAYQVFLDDKDHSAISSMLELLMFVVPAVIILSLALLALTSRRMMTEIVSVIKDGPLYWFSIVCAAMALFCFTGFLLAWTGGMGMFLLVGEPNAQVASLAKYPSTMFPARSTNEIAVESGEGAPIEFGFDAGDVDKLTFISDAPMRISSEPFDPMDDVNQIGLGLKGEGEPEIFYSNRLASAMPFDGFIETLYIKNLGGKTAALKMTVSTQPPIPQVRVVFVTAISVVALFLLYLLQQAAMPKISAIALSTFKTEVAQPLYILLLGMGALMLATFIYIPGNTFGEDIKILKDSGLTVILIFTIFMAVYAASKSLAEEIEGRTALTVLSKPVGRRQFILGKFYGIAWSVLLMYTVLGIVLAVCVAYKPVYDSKEVVRDDVDWIVSHIETMRIIPGLVLGYMEVLVFVAISIVISTRLPIMANLMICFAIYVLGHLTPLMVQSSVAVEAFEPVVFIGQLIAVILPVLDHFNIQAAVSGDTEVPLRYLGWSSIYCLVYGTIAMLLALIFFEDRDLA